MLGGESFTIYPCRGEYAELSPPGARSSTASSIRCRTSATASACIWCGPLAERSGSDRPSEFQDRKDDYEDDRLPLEAFLEPTRRCCRRVTLADLRLSGSGIRAKLHPPDEPRGPTS